MRVKYKYSETVETDLKTIDIHVKCTDAFAMSLYDKEGHLILEHDGEVPSFFPGQHYGDYLILSIDPTTGAIVNWSTTAEQVGDFIEEKLSEG